MSLKRWTKRRSVAFAILLCSSITASQSWADELDEAAGRATSVSNVAVATFNDTRPQKNEGTMKALTEAVVARTNARTYLKAKVLGASLSFPQRPPSFRDILGKAGTDALLVAAVNDRDVRWSLIGPEGTSVMSGQLNSAGLGSEADLSLTADRIVDAIAAAVPYRGFITKEVEPDVYDINIGSNVGLTKGQKLRVFDFGGMDFNSKRSDTGIVQVIDVREDMARVEAVSGAKHIHAFQKIAFEDKARGMNRMDPGPTTGYLMLGGGVLTIASDSPSAAYDKKVYRLSSTPTLIIGAGFGKTELSASIAQAQSATEDLIFAEALLDREFAGNPASLWGWKFLGGLRYASYQVTSDSVVKSSLESASAVSPHLALTFEHFIGGPLVFTAGLEAMPFMYWSTSNSNILFSYGGAGNLGFRFEFSPRWTLDTSIRLESYRRPVDSNSAVQERHSFASGALKMRF